MTRRSVEFATAVLLLGSSLVSAQSSGHYPVNPTTLLKIEVLDQQDDQTVVVLHGNTEFQAFGYRHYPAPGDNPREVVRLRGIEHPWERGPVEVGDGVLERITSTYDSDHNPPELHLLFDLASHDVVISSIERAGTRLVIILAFEDAEPSPTAVHTAVAPTPRPTATPTPLPVVQSPAPTSSSVTVGTSPTPGAEGPRVSAGNIVEISTSEWPDGSTLMRISGDGPISGRGFRHFRLFGEPPRYVVNIGGVSAPDLPGVVEFDGSNVTRVRLISRAANELGELQLVFDLAESGVTVDEVAHQGAHIVFRLVPPPPE